MEGMRPSDNKQPRHLLTFIPESEDKPIRRRFQLVIVGANASVLANLLHDSELNSAFRPKGSQDLKSTASERMTLTYKSNRPGSCHSEEDDGRLRLFMPINACTELLCLVLRPVSQFSSTMPQIRDKADALDLLVLLLHWRCPEGGFCKELIDKTADHSLMDFRMRAAEIKHNYPLPPTLHVLWCSSLDEETEALNAFHLHANESSLFGQPFDCVKVDPKQGVEAFTEAVLDVVQELADRNIALTDKLCSFTDFEPPKAAEKSCCIVA